MLHILTIIVDLAIIFTGIAYSYDSFKCSYNNWFAFWVMYAILGLILLVKDVL